MMARKSRDILAGWHAVLSLSMGELYRVSFGGL